MRETLTEGVHKASDSDVKQRLADMRQAGDETLADAIERSWVLHDKLGDALLKMQNSPSVTAQDSENVMKLADDLSNSFNVIAKIVGAGDDTIDEASSDASTAVERAWRAQMRNNLQTMSQELSFGVQYPIHNALERLLFDKR